MGEKISIYEALETEEKIREGSVSKTALIGKEIQAGYGDEENGI